MDSKVGRSIVDTSLCASLSTVGGGCCSVTSEVRQPNDLNFTFPPRQVPCIEDSSHNSTTPQFHNSATRKGNDAHRRKQSVKETNSTQTARKRHKRFHWQYYAVGLSCLLRCLCCSAVMCHAAMLLLLHAARPSCRHVVILSSWHSHPAQGSMRYAHDIPSSLPCYHPKCLDNLEWHHISEPGRMCWSCTPPRKEPVDVLARRI